MPLLSWKYKVNEFPDSLIHSFHMKMSKEIVINFDKLEREVHNAMHAEEKYSRENQAKFRAIEQRAATYEDFRQIVLASNLKPLDKGETLRTVTVKNTWNLTAANGKADEAKDNSLKLEIANLADVVPKTNLEFMQIWRKIGDDRGKKWEFITNIGADRLVELFKAEINGEMLGKFLNLFHSQLSESQNDADLVLRLLNGFPKCNRFELNILFLQKSELELCKQIFAILANFYQDHPNDTQIDYSSLQNKYFK